MSFTNWLRSATNSRRSAHRPGTRLGVQHLEAREVPAIDFASAVAVGSTTGSSRAEGVAADAAGNSYLTGYFNGTVDFDPAHTHPGDADILTDVGGGDIFVAKYAPDDSLVWARRMGAVPGTGGTISDDGRAISVDAAGNVYVTGQFIDTADFGPFTLTSAGIGQDGFVTKLNAAGTVLWAKRWGLSDTMTTLGEQGKGVDTDAAGNVYVLGSMLQSPATYGYNVLKFSASGSLQWNKFLNTQTTPTNGDLAADAAGNVYITGSFAGTVDFDLASNKTKNIWGGNYNAFALKLTSAGNFGWASALTNAHGQCLARDGSGNVILGGWYSGTVRFSQYGAANVLLPTTLPATSGGYIAKLTSTGGLTWTRAIEKAASGSTIFVDGLDTDAAGNIYATGSFHGTIDLDPGTGTLLKQSVPHANGTSDSTDVFLLKLTSAGSFSWGESFGGNYHDIGWGVAVDPTGLIHLAGGCAGLVDFDPDPVDTYVPTTPGLGTNIFLTKLRQS